VKANEYAFLEIPMEEEEPSSRVVEDFREI